MKTIFRTVLLLCLTTFTINAEPLINLDKVLDIFTATAKAIPAAESKEAAKRDARIQTFVTKYTKSLNEAKIANSPLAAEYQADGSFLGFNDSNKNGKKDAGEKDLFKIELFPEEQKIIASDLTHIENRNAIRVRGLKPVIIKAGDILHIQIPYNEGNTPQRDSLYIVSQHNFINLGKGIGITKTKHLTTAGLEKHIEKLFNHTKPLPTITVTIIRQKANEKSIQMLGNLNKPTTLDVKNNHNLELAMNQCGGATPFAATNRIQLIRNKTTTLLNLKNQDAKDIPLQSGDILFFPQKRWIGR